MDITKLMNEGYILKNKESEHSILLKIKSPSDVLKGTNKFQPQFKKHLFEQLKVSNANIEDGLRFSEQMLKHITKDLSNKELYISLWVDFNTTLVVDVWH